MRPLLYQRVNLKDGYSFSTEVPRSHVSLAQLQKVHSISGTAGLKSSVEKKYPSLTGIHHRIGFRTRSETKKKPHATLRYMTHA